MTNSTDSQFDPRFDPAFQPGYDPAKHVTPPVRREVPQQPEATPPAVREHRTDASQPAAIQPRPRTASADHLTPAVVPAPITPTSVTPTPVGSVPLSPDPAAGSAEGVAVRRPEPYLVALWVISAVLIAGGVYSLRLIGDRIAALTSSGDFGGPGYYLLQALTIGAPMLIVLGIATAVGTVFLLAARHPHAPRD